MVNKLLNSRLGAVIPDPSISFDTYLTANWSTNTGYTVPDVITRCCTLLAAGIISTSPEDKVDANTYWKQGMLLLESLGEETTTGSTYNTITIDGFGRFSDVTTDPSIIW